jgi:two-component system nitrogen regulation response regulator GlnG
VLYTEDTIGESVIAQELAQAPPEPARPGTAEPAAEEGLASAVERHLDRYFKAHDGALPPPGLYDRLMREVERPLVVRALSATRGNQLRAADLLGLNRNTLRKKIRDLDIPFGRGP